MLQGILKLDVPVTTELGELMGVTNHVGIEVEPDDLEQDPCNPLIYTTEWDSPAVFITVTVQQDGSTAIVTEPKSIIIENTLHT